LDHSSGMIQIVLTLCCAYWSFIFVEGVLGLSGVLATVAASVVLANHMWPYVACEESMHHVWHTFEALGNMIVFFLAGSKTGDIFLEIDAIDYLNLIFIYVFLVVIRAGIIFGSRPVLKLLNADRLEVKWQDATLMTWGGLRGAVGLALALAVDNDRAPYYKNTGDFGLSAPLIAGSQAGDPQITEKTARRMLFFVSGIAFLTTMVNATTAPTLVAKLGITALPHARKALLKMFHCQLVVWSTDSKYPPEVTETLKEMLHEAEHHIDHQSVSENGPKSTRTVAKVAPEGHGKPSAGHGKPSSSPKPKSGMGTGAVVAPEKAGNSSMTLYSARCSTMQYQSNPDVIVELREAEAAYKALPQEDKGLMGKALEENLLGKVDGIIDLVKDQYVDVGTAKVVNQIFLTLVYNNYWKFISEGALRPGSVESEVLFTSVRMSLSPYRSDLVDYSYVHEKMLADKEFAKAGGNESDDDIGGGLADAEVAGAVDKGSRCGSLVASWQFNVSVVLAILFNSLQVAAEEIWKKEGDDNIAWLGLDGFFSMFFLFEFFSKFCAMKCGYFKTWWNRFDFFLVTVGVFGFVMGIATMGQGSEMAGKTRIIRIARVLRTLRFLRIFRLFHARMSADKYVSLELARHMKKVVTLDCFIRAHTMAQVDLIKYFAGNNEVDMVHETELGRCVLQSQVVTYQALCQVAKTQAQLGDEVYLELKGLHKRKMITEGLGQFVMDAHSDGAISATEAHSILHPLNHNIAQCVRTLADRAEGVLETKKSGDGKDVHVDPMKGDGTNSRGSRGQEVQETPVAVKSPASEDSLEVVAPQDLSKLPASAVTGSVAASSDATDSAIVEGSLVQVDDLPVAPLRETAAAEPEPPPPLAPAPGFAPSGRSS